jgi:hypothetical protein
MPVPYSEPPACTSCGGALSYDAEQCVCGGRSQNHAGPTPRQMIQVQESRGTSWDEAYQRLWERYVPPE